MNIRRTCATGMAATAVIATLLIAPQTAFADVTGTPHAVTGLEYDPARVEGINEPEDRPVVPVVANYHGRKINLVTQGWGAARICSVDAPGLVNCYDDDADLVKRTGATTPTSRSQVAAASAEPANQTCTSSYSCLFQDAYENAGTTGRRLQFRDPGRHQLGDYNFRDQTSGVYNKMAAGKFLQAWDARSFQNDPSLLWRWATWTDDLSQVSYGGGGTWNDKIDYIEIRQS